MISTTSTSCNNLQSTRATRPRPRCTYPGPAPKFLDRQGTQVRQAAFQAEAQGICQAHRRHVGVRAGLNCSAGLRPLLSYRHGTPIHPVITPSRHHGRLHDLWRCHRHACRIHAFDHAQCRYRFREHGTWPHDLHPHDGHGDVAWGAHRPHCLYPPGPAGGTAALRAVAAYLSHRADPAVVLPRRHSDGRCLWGHRPVHEHGGRRHRARLAAAGVHDLSWVRIRRRGCGCYCVELDINSRQALGPRGSA